MNLKNHLFAIVWGGLVGVLVLAAGFLLWQQRSHFASVRADLDTAEQSLQTLNRRVPFPSQENVLITETNLVRLRRFVDGVQEQLSQPRIEPEEMVGARFNGRLESSLRRMSQRAEEGKPPVLLPPQFSFGFETYAGGAIPKTEDVPRLSVQLQMVESLFDLLLTNRIDSLVAIRRETFDRPDLTGAAGEGFFYEGFSEGGLQPSPDAVLQEGEASDLYSTEHFDIVFTARGSNAVDVLQTLSTSGVFVVVTDLQAQNLAAGETGALSPSFEAPSRFPEELGASPSGMGRFNFEREEMAEPRFREGMERSGRSRELQVRRKDRQMAGNGILRVTMGLDVYRFNPPEREEAGEPEAEPGTEPGIEPEAGPEEAAAPADRALAGLGSSAPREQIEGVVL